MVRDRLDSGGIPAAVFSQRDHLFNLTIGNLARVYVMVPESFQAQALTLLGTDPLTDEELEGAAEQSDPRGIDKTGPETEEPLDSGIETLRFPGPEDAPDENLA